MMLVIIFLNLIILCISVFFIMGDLRCIKSMLTILRNDNMGFIDTYLDLRLRLEKLERLIKDEKNGESVLLIWL